MPKLPTSPDGIAIRPATPADAPELAAVISQAFEQYRGQLVPESGEVGETPDAIETELQGRTEALLALHGSAVVGGVVIVTSGDDLYLGRLAVRPTARPPHPQAVARTAQHAIEPLLWRFQGVRLTRDPQTLLPAAGLTILESHRQARGLVLRCRATPT